MRNPGTWRAQLLIVGLIGAALLCGDGAITPATSVLSAIEGLKVDAPSLAPAVLAALSPLHAFNFLIHQNCR